MRRSDAGFTLVELIIAMAVFSFMLVIIAAGYIQLVKVYQGGVASRTTQQNARVVMDGIVQTIRSSGRAWPSSPAISTQSALAAPTTGLCFASGVSGAVEYAIDHATNDLYTKVVSATYPSCPIPANFSGWTKLNDASVSAQLLQAQVTSPVNGTLGTVVVTLGFASRTMSPGTLTLTVDSTNIINSSLKCAGGAGSQFCAATTLTTAGTLRGYGP